MKSSYLAALSGLLGVCGITRPVGAGYNLNALAGLIIGTTLCVNK